MFENVNIMTEKEKGHRPASILKWLKVQILLPVYTSLETFI